MHKSPIVYNVDWSIPVPLQMIGFHLILKAAQKPVSFEVLLETSLGTGVMLAVGYAGKTGVLEVWIDFSQMPLMPSTRFATSRSPTQTRSRLSRISSSSMPRYKVAVLVVVVVVVLVGCGGWWCVVVVVVMVCGG